MNGVDSTSGHFTNLTAGLYVWKVEDEYGCVFSASTILSQPGGMLDVYSNALFYRHFQ